ncbi:hypothetical protein SASPL_115015 [Salvia splendens]|uniref:RNase H type-1 domain-containing protein n=1 Tax=Salvia splendens TaxID=180675 RepID=A0A8X8Y5U0_SALSN|nr:hypothetical protein SASPL_115015 [Salvia splendens]
MALLFTSPLSSVCLTSPSTSRISANPCIRLTHNAIAMHQRSFVGGRIQAPFFLNNRGALMVKAASDVDGTESIASESPVPTSGGKEKHSRETKKAIKLIRWIPPDTGWLKLNVDGVWSNGEAGAGGTLRDDGGNLICGFKAKVVASSRMDATLQAVSIGLNMATERGQQIWLEIGEQGIAQMLTARQYGAATMRHQLTEIKNKLKARNTKISYIAIEGNKVATHLAQQGCNTAQLEIFDQQSATHLVMAMVRMEHLGVPNLQFRG